jgi:hypothetical protein
MDGRYLSLLYVDPANKHDITIIKENEEYFSGKFRSCTVLLYRGYVDERFAEAIRAKSGEYIVIKSGGEKLYYQSLSRMKEIIETRFSQLEEFEARLIRAVSIRGLAVKITPSYYPSTYTK